MLVTEYLELQQKYEKQYGNLTVLLMQVGSFYEIYGYAPSNCSSKELQIDKDGKLWDENVGHAAAISSILNCVLTQENNNEPYSCLNPSKVGFPVVAYEKNRDRLLENNYVIVRMDQDKSTGKVTREVAEVCSPTTEINCIAPTRATSNIACIYIEYQQGTKGRFDNFVITTGVSILDVITGQNKVCEFYSKDSDQIYPVQELYRFLISHAPREIVVHLNDMPAGLDTNDETNPNPYVKYLEKVLELNRFERVKVCVNAVPLDYKKPSYHETFFNKVFTKPANSQTSRLNIIQKRNEHIIENIGLERMNYGRMSYMLLLQHCYEHNHYIISKLSKPDLKWLDEDKHLVLTHNAIVQLDIIGNGTNKGKGIDSLVSVLDHNRTHLGRRLLYTLLQNPMKNAKEINSHYDMVDDMLNSKVGDDPMWIALDRMLKELPDVGRLQRKLEIRLITPKELAILYAAYVKLVNMYIVILQSSAEHLKSQMFTPSEIAEFNSFMQKFSSIIDFAALECCKIEISAETGNKWIEFVDCPIRSGAYPDIDEQVRALQASETNLQVIVDHLNGFLNSTKGKKIEFKAGKKKQGAKKNDPTDTFLVTTAAKANILLSSPVDNNLCGAVQILPYTTTEKVVSSDRIVTLTTHIDAIKNWLRQRLLAIYDSIIDDMNASFTFFAKVADIIARIDLVHSYAKVASMYNYHRPQIVEDSTQSFLEAREIRHPIIERLIEDAYVKNDVYLGAGNETRSNGMLLFGLNMAGKSSLTKAIALNIVMAQAGCFVPSRLRYSPYSKIITRISDSDNIFKGQSSFAVEMTELRTILRQSNGNTLVVGDELSKGTESNSGMAITASTLLSLVQSKATFVFATHMHDLLNLDVMKSIPAQAMKVCHISVSYDDQNKILLYDRKLKEGSGSSVYGLMVARYLDLPTDFIETANSILLVITGQNRNIVEPKTSHFNKKVYVDSCAMCGSTSSQKQLQTHHIQEQHKAVAGLIGSMHKNVKNNLIVLCETCHRNMHAKDIELEVVSTVQGKAVRVKAEECTASS